MKLEIYMKSGNVIRLPFVQKYKFNVKGDDITSVEITRIPIWPGRKLLVQTINLSQIEAIVRK